jgi:ubiquinone/menaquinone biosynthesis C-methylase UbiE
MDPQADEGEAFLKGFHSRHPGATAFALEVPPGERSSYDELADLVPRSGGALDVVDLACGDGALLERLHRRQQPALRLTGIDMSPDELAAARRRLPNGVEFREERAQQLTLADRSVDVVLCHLAFMLMRPIEPVVAEIARVLRPGGFFASVGRGDMVRGDALEAFQAIALEELERERVKLPSIGDPRSFTAEGMRTLFHAGSGFAEPILVRDIVVPMVGTVERVLASLMLLYFPAVLSEPGRERVRGRARIALRSLCDAEGRVRASIGGRLAICHRATSPSSAAAKPSSST